MPCLNEARTVVRCIEKALGFFRREGIAAEVIVADNGSSDGSRQLAQQAGARVVAIAEKGYGNALRGGFAQAKGRYIIMGDADDSYDFSRLEAFVEKLRQGSDLVMGNRFRGGILPGAMPALHRYLGNPVPSDRLKRLVTKWTIERGLYVGIPLILAGVAGAVYALFFWSRAQFGNLDPVQLFRIILPTGFLMIHGLLLLFSAFLLHALITQSSEHSSTPPSTTTP